MINAYLIDDVTIKYLTTIDQWQTPTWTTIAVKGRVEWNDKLIRNAQGEQVVSAALVYLAGDITPPTNADRIILGLIISGIESIEHAIMRVDKKTDFSTSHFEIFIT